MFFTVFDLCLIQVSCASRHKFVFSDFLQHSPICFSFQVQILFCFHFLDPTTNCSSLLLPAHNFFNSSFEKLKNSIFSAVLAQLFETFFSTPTRYARYVSFSRIKMMIFGLA